MVKSVATAPDHEAAADAIDRVTLSRAEYQALLDRIEELEEDLEAALMPQIEFDPASVMPAEVVYRMIDNDESALRAWRKYRGLTLIKLATKAGLSTGYLSDIELGKRTGSLDTLKTLAAVLDCGLQTLIE